MKTLVLIASLLVSTSVFAHGKDFKRGRGHEHSPSPRVVVVPKVVYKPYRSHYRDYKRYHREYRGFIFRPIIIIK